MNFIEENISYDFESYKEQQCTLLSYKLNKMNEKYQSKNSLFCRQLSNSKTQKLQPEQSLKYEQTADQQTKVINVSLRKYLKHKRNKKRQCLKNKTFTFTRSNFGFSEIQKIDKNNNYIERVMEIKQKELQQSQITYRFIRMNEEGYSLRKVIYQDKFESISTLTGKGFILISNGASVYGKWDQGEPIGNLIIHYPNGMIYEGEVYNYKHHGIGTLHYPTGQKYTGEFSFGGRHGKGTLFGKDGKIILSGQWKKNHFQK